jgi:hypothetical protein
MVSKNATFLELAFLRITKREIEKNKWLKMEHFILNRSTLLRMSSLSIEVCSTLRWEKMPLFETRIAKVLF